MTVRPDNRLADVPLRPVVCRGCGATVEARKSSWAQTSVQWTADAMARCPQRREAATLTGLGNGVFLLCSALRDSIEDAARRGDLPVVDEAGRDQASP